jgi:hypothetical protein
MQTSFADNLYHMLWRTCHHQQFLNHWQEAYKLYKYALTVEILMEAPLHRKNAQYGALFQAQELLVHFYQ